MEDEKPNKKGSLILDPDYLEKHIKTLVARSESAFPEICTAQIMSIIREYLFLTRQSVDLNKTNE